MSRFISEDRRRRIAAKPQWAMVAAFAVTILIGAALLTLPAASTGGEPLRPLEALFTATSATCVTGLTVVDVGARLTLFGQLVVLSLIQLGGLGIMTLGTFLLVLTGRRLSMRNESILLTSLGSDEVPALRSLLYRTITFTLLIESCGAILLTWRHLEGGMAPVRAIYYGVFHAVSAFCNAGFALFPNNSSLISMSGDTSYLIAVALLITSGGLGFLVLHNLSVFKFWRRSRRTRGRITMHSRMALSATVFLIATGGLAFLALEQNASLAGLSWDDKTVGALFQSVTVRTAGYNSVPMSSLSEPGRLLSIGLMFVGGAPGSTAGGVKTTTMIVLILTILAMIRGRHTTLYRGRAIPEAVVREAIVIFMLSIFFITAAFGALMLTEAPAPGSAASLPLLFETVSAFATVGLSLDVTPGLSAAGRIIIIMAMFVGRLGPLTVALIVGRSGTGERLQYPEEEVVVG
ncbi:MAG: potassium transporter TrkG [Kiritimatiellae bacterium]|nr:potassium transporter TrkG [Kiritimatiellia bacterium]